MRVFSTYRALLANAPLRRLLFGEFVSSIGDWLYLVAILVVVYRESESALLLGVIGAGRIVPYILLSIPAGMVVDRFDRRAILIVTDVARGVVMLGLAILIATDAPLTPVVALTLLAACFSTFFGPAIGAFLPTLVDESELGPANSAWASLDNLAFVIGPAVAGILIAVGGLTLAFVLNAVSFAIVAAVLWRLPRAPHPPRGSTAEHAGEGADEDERPRAGASERPDAAPLRGLARPLTGLAIVNSVGGFVFGGLSVLTVVIAVDVIRQGDAATGFLNAAIGIGGLAGALASAALVLRPRLAAVLIGGGLAFAIGLVVVGQSQALLPALLGMSITAAGSLIVEVVATTVFQRAVPDAIRGRAFGAMETVAVTAYAGGSLLLPVLAGAFGVPLTLALSGAAVAAACAGGTLLIGPAATRSASLDPLRERFTRLAIFAGLPPARLDSAARRLVEVPVRAGETVIREGEPADRFYMIGSGRFLVTQRGDRAGDQRELRRMGPDEVFGEIGLLRRSPRTATVSGLDDGVLLALDGGHFLELVGSGPGLTSRLLDLHRGAAAGTAG